jgi:D-alanyl-D-alanine dipeptidase
VDRDLADGLMWTLHGRTFRAPTFELGIAPAGCMYSSVNELAQFMTVLFGGGRAGERQILKPETLQQMWKVQFAEGKEGFGLGFHLQTVKGERLAGHGGAIYGFSTSFAALVDAKVGAVVIASKDFANTVADKIAYKALVAMLAVKTGAPLQDLPHSYPLQVELQKAMEGRYVGPDKFFDLERRVNSMGLLWQQGGFMQNIRHTSTNLVSDGAIGFGLQIGHDWERHALKIGDTEYTQTQAPKPRDIPARWRGLIGEYGWDHDVLYILEREGQLWSLIEWFEFDPLEEVSENVFKFPNRGLYDGESIVFAREGQGAAGEAVAANVHFKRRAVGPQSGGQLQLKPTRPVEEIRAEALRQQPPQERTEFRKSELVELIKFDPSLKLDIRYAGTNNFLGVPFYTQSRAFLQRVAAEAVSRANSKLREKGYGLLIFDGYRPWFVTKIFWEATPDEQKFLVADPSKGSRHNRGCAVDLTLCDLSTGKPVEMVGTYDEATDRSFPDYPGGTSLQRWHRKLLRDAMEEEGFTVYDEEWWHFDFNGWREYAIQNIPFEKVSPAEPRIK